MSIKQHNDRPKVVFCLPGNNFSGRFLECWSQLLAYCANEGIEYYISRHYSPVIYFVRNQCLGGNITKGVTQVPFQDELNYTHTFWIDSDIVFTPQQFQALLDHDEPIASGIYKMIDNFHFATAKEFDFDYLNNHGRFPFLTEEDLTVSQGLTEVAYTGLGFTAIKREVFESLEYPWFRPKTAKVFGIDEIISEDASFCIDAADKGFKTLIDTSIIVGHEKSVILS